MRVKAWREKSDTGASRAGATREGTAWVERKISSACDNVKAKMAAALGQNDWKISSKFYLTISIGLSGKIPRPGKIGMELSMGWSSGFASSVKTRFVIII